MKQNTGEGMKKKRMTLSEITHPGKIRTNMQRQDTDFEEKFEEVWEQVSYKAG